MAISFLNIYSIFQSIFSSVFPSNIILYISSIYHLISIFQSTRLCKPRLRSQAHINAEWDFNPRGYVSLDWQGRNILNLRKNFNPRGYVSLDEIPLCRAKPPDYFNPRGYVSLDIKAPKKRTLPTNFNPRGYVSLDYRGTYRQIYVIRFQSTRLRKPRPIFRLTLLCDIYFNPRGYVSLDG